MFSQKHFKAIAALINERPVDATVSARGAYASPLPSPSIHAYCLVDDLCDLFAADNPKFNKHRFIKACGFEPWDQIIMGVPFTNEEIDNARR